MADTLIVSDLRYLINEGKTFGTIYADPPWKYDNTAARGAAGKHYACMTVEEICALPVNRLAAPDARLFLWTTNAFLFESINIVKAWGFEFLGTFHWLKPDLGTGNYYRNSHETMLICARPGATPPAEGMPGWIEVKRGRHSAKPEHVRRIIERASAGPFLELFGRAPAPGWTVFGNEIDRGLLFHDLPDEGDLEEMVLRNYPGR